MKRRSLESLAALERMYAGFSRAVRAAESIVRPAAATPSESQSRADSADTSRLFPGGVPKNPDVCQLVCELDAGRGSGKSNIAIAREFTAKMRDPERKAQSLLREVRRLVKAGKVNL